MAENIRNPGTENLTEVLARLMGDAKTEAVTRRRLADELDEIALHCSRLPVLDPRTPDEILGYDDHGSPR